MEKENNVINLKNYINNQEDVVTLNHNVFSNFSKMPKANLSKRGIAFFVDLLSIGVLKTVIDSGYAIFIAQFMAPASTTMKSQLMHTNMFFQLSLFITIYCAYFLYCNFIFDGKTLGKMTMKLTTINEDFVFNFKDATHEINFNQSLKRSLGYLLCYISMGTFFIFNFSSEDKRGLSDYLSGSRTVSDDWLEQALSFKAHQLEEVTIDIYALEKDKAA